MRPPVQASPSAPPTAAATPQSTATAVLRSVDLLGTQQSVFIEHQGQRYRLQTTRLGKLILTK